VAHSREEAGSKDVPKIDGSFTQLIGEWPIEIDGDVFRPIPSSSASVVWQRADLLTIAANIRPNGPLVVSVGRPDRYPTSEEIDLATRGVFADGTEVRFVGARKIEAHTTSPFFVASLTEVVRSEQDG
jgi:hypothetical protein